ncbi:MAG: hypothetical protein HQL20_00890 [Candidatus Omnitrophica bacterium]|nr:hypothetical protein [Candidatus Omnitrophota bacterium]
MNHIIKDLSQRVWLAYLLIIIVLCLIGSYKDIFSATYILAVDHLAPAYDYSTTVGFNSTPSKEQLETGIYYYNRCVETFPGEKGHAWHMLGYYLYLYGDKKNAIQAIEKSVELVPVFFWSQYNRGVYYFNEKDFAKAAEAFNGAASLDMRLTVMVILNSKTYLQVLCRSSSQTKANNPSIKLIDTFNKTRGYQALSQFCLQNPGHPACSQALQMNYF